LDWRFVVVSAVPVIRQRRKITPHKHLFCGQVVGQSLISGDATGWAISPPITRNQPEKAQISVEGAEHLYKEIRVENPLQDESGNEVTLKKGAKVEVKIEADPEATEPNNSRQ
jgi:hypothetical protein